MLEQRPPRNKRLLVGDPQILDALPASAGLLWLRPDQRLLLGDGPIQHDPPTDPAIHVLDVSARFVEFTLHGPQACDLLAAGCGLDLRERAFAPGACAQSRIEPVPVILHREALDRCTVIVERPLARYLWHWLEHNAALLGGGKGNP